MDKLFLLLLWIGVFSFLAQAKFRSLHCQLYDKDMANIKICKINAVNRNKNLINIKVDLYKTVEKDIQAQVEIFKRANGWHPFLYNFKFDVCKFLKKPYNLIAIIAFSYMRTYTNVNHTCPFVAGSSLILKNFDLDVDQFRSRFPIENGEYALKFSLFVNNMMTFSANGSIYHFNYMDQ